MADRLPGTPEEYLTAERAAMFRRDCRQCGVPPRVYIDGGRYSGGEYGMRIQLHVVAAWMCEGLLAFGMPPVKP